jgi:hypothetical protein
MAFALEAFQLGPLQLTDAPVLALQEMAMGRL